MKRRIFLDTNVVIDFLSKRAPFGEDAKQIFSLSPRYNQLCISALSFTTIYYILRRHYEHQVLLEMLDVLCQMVEVLPTDASMITSSIHSKFHDFEDAVQYYTALSGNSSVIITRNPKDFTHSSIPIYTPTDFLTIPYWLTGFEEQELNEPEVKYQ